VFISSGASSAVLLFTQNTETLKSFETSKTIISRQGAASGKTKCWNMQCMQLAIFYIHGLRGEF